MPYGFGGGLAAGFDSGVQNGTQIAEVRLRREALMKEQMNELIKNTATGIDAGLKNIQGLVSSQAQRTPQLEQAVKEQQAQLTDAANMLMSLGTPEAQQAGKMALSTINAVVMSAKTQSEVNTEANVAKVSGAYEASKKGPEIFGQGGAQASPAMAAPAAGSPIPMDGAAIPANADTSMLGSGADAMPAPAPVAGEQVAQAAPAPAPAQPMGQEELFNQFMDRGESAGMTSAQKKQLSDAVGAGHNLFSALDDYDALLKEHGRQAAVPGTTGNKLVQQSRTNIQLLLKELAALGAITGPDLELMEKMIFDPSSMSALMNFKDLSQSSNNALRHMIANKVQSVEAGIANKPLPPVKETGDKPQQAKGAGASAQAKDLPTFATEEEAAAAGLPDGTRIILNGVPGTWRN
jgi:hypothetical protein